MGRRVKVTGNGGTCGTKEKGVGTKESQVRWMGAKGRKEAAVVWVIW